MNSRQQLFIKEYSKGRSAGQAYAKAYDRPLNDYAHKAGHRLMKNEEVRATLEEIEKNMPIQAAEAFQNYVDLAKDPKTPANVKERIYSRIMSLGGLVETQKIEQKNETTFKGLNDDTNWIEKALEGIREKKE